MYVPLNIKTDNYLQSSMIKINDLILFAKNNNLSALTITDNNLYGAIDFYKACVNNNIKPIIGLEVVINDKKIILYAKDYVGYLNLVKIATLQSENNLILAQLIKYNNNIIAILPCEGIELYDSLKNHFELFVSYKNKEEKSLIHYPKLYMEEIKFINKNHFKYIKYLEAIRDGISVKFIENDYKNNYLKLENEIIQDDIKNNYYIFNSCNIEIKFNNDLMPKYHNDLNVDSLSYLKKLCIDGALKRFGKKIGKVYQERLKYELSIIEKMGFSDYFLIVADYVNFAKSNNIIVGTGRGSAVSSLVAYLLNIIDVDPLKYNLLFERFLNPERISMPDIDIDFEHEKRDIVINYCINKYGEKKVAPIIAFGTLGAKGAIRDVGRCLNVDLRQIDSICKLLDSKLTLKENYQTNKRLQLFLSRKNDLMNLYQDAVNFEGLKRHTTIHAAGIVMSNTDLDNIIPLDYHGNFYTSGYDMTYLEEIGLLKMDFLAIKYLTTIHNIIDLVNKNHGTNIIYDEIKIDDASINIFKEADTIGIFQFESAGMINFLSKLQPSSIDDIIASIALYRPGPMKNIDTFIKRKQGLLKIDYINPSLEEILKSTYGIIVYQEQIMLIAQVMADYSLGEADILRKAMSKKKKDLLESQQEIFKNRSLKKGYDEKTIDKVFNLMLKFAEYGFNKSHSVGYSIIALKMAYLKAHYRAEFYSCLLEGEKGNKEKIRLYIYELRKNNIQVLNPDINKSSVDYKIDGNCVIYPLASIKGLNLNAAQFIVSERVNGEYKDIYDFISRCYGKVVNKKVIESLIYAGTFNSLGLNRRTLINNLDIIINYGELLKDVGEYALKPEISILNEYSNKEIMNYELEFFGIYLKNHPVTEARNNRGIKTMISDVKNHFNREISLVVFVNSIKETETKNKDKMAFITGTDEINDISIVLFPKIYERYHINEKDIIYLKGTVEKRLDNYQVIANYLEKIDY